ncbi:hypothetical protein IKG68_03280 [Candidatus Saccharibacteria bacterium]|nr:hypothetical protein [Candidatus Saccharibacteria bacterium]
MFSIAAFNLCNIPITTSAESYGTALSVQDDTYLNVAIPNSVVLNITPTAAGQFAKTSMDISVDTNNATGYTLTMTADTTSLSRTSAVNGVDYTIPTLSSAATCTDESDTTCDTFPVGYWGYKFTNAEVATSSTYNPVSTDVTKLRFQKEFNSSVDTTTVTFGTKLSNSIPNGTYDGVNFTFIATTNYVIPETAKYMQDFNAVIADSLTPGITYTTKDSRDNQDYTVAKLADGNVWMTKNLNLDLSGVTLNQNNTNATSDIISRFGAYKVTEAFGNFQTGQYNPSFSTTVAETDNNWATGIFYNYCAASAGTYCRADGSPSNENNISYDICPAKWRIPTGGASGETTKLLSFYSDKVTLKNALQFPRAGLFVGNGILQTNTQGFFWTTTQDSNSAIYTLMTYGADYFDANRTNTRNFGLPVRCIKDRSMQNFSATDAAAMEVGQTITLVDNRDNQEYTVAKFPDGKVWMTKNLNLAGGTALTSDNTNMAAGYVMPTSVGFQEGNKLPESSMQGFDNNDMAFVYNSGSEDCESETGCYSYYSWHAATLGSVAVDDGWKTAPYDICPKGWRMPTAQLEDTSLDLSYDFSRLSYSINGGQMIIRYTSSTNPTYLEMFSILRASPYLFVGSGNIKDSVFTESMLQDAMYWSAYAGQIGNRTASFVWLIHGSDSSFFYGSHTRQNGKAVRCLFAG